MTHTTATACSPRQVPENGTCPSADRDALLLSVHRLVVKLVRQRVRDRHWAEDIAQDVCLRILHTWTRYDAAKGKATTWAGWQVRSVLARSAEREARRVSHWYRPLTGQLSAGLHSRDRPPEETAERAEVVALVRETLAELEAEDAGLLRSRLMEGESLTALGRRAGQKRETVRKRVAVAAGHAGRAMKRRGLQC